MRPSLRVSAFLALALAAALLFPTRPSIGQVRSGDRLAFALTGAKVIAAPGRVFDPGTVIVRGGVIEAAGPVGRTTIPADARVFDLSGKVVHAAFVDPYVFADRLAGKKPKGPSDEEEPQERERESAPPRRTPAPGDHPLASVRAEERTVDSLVIRDQVAETYRRLGFAVVHAVPQTGILRGRSAVVSLGEGPVANRILDAETAHCVSLEPERFDFAAFTRANYPNSKMGAVALVRQTLRDALWWKDARAAYAKSPVGQARPIVIEAHAALLPAAEGREPVFFEATDVLSLLRGGKIAREMKLKAVSVGVGDEYRLREQVVASKPDLVLRVDFPRPYRLDEEAEWLDVPLERLRHIDRAPSNPEWMKDAGLTFSFTTAGLDDPEDFGRRVREAIARGLSRDDALAAVTTVPARQLGMGDRLGSLEAGRIANIAVATGEPFAPGAKIVEIWIDGKRHVVPEKRKRDGDSVPPKGEGEKALPADVRPFPSREDGPVATPAAVVVRGATIWTQAPGGTLENADLVVSGGRITAVGRALAAPAGALEVDGRGKHVTPGLIDAHSHTGIDGQVNEGTHNVTAEVRIKDVLDPFDVAIYRELAGGLTAANVLHGSANAIGGQNAIVKWRRGGGPDDLLFAAAPEGIKFALGENPKRSNFASPTPRYPQTRMGVANLIRERFLAARDYRKRQAEHRIAVSRKGASPVPPRPDLQLEAIAEILEGKRKIHCHSYVKGEILEMIRVAEEFGVQVATFQHVLEGYKVADEMAKHGAGASLFSDWWGYKFEVFDAIPYAGALLRERGVVVSFNSDSDELARRLNTEAAKAVKYGGVPPVEALAFVTSNPARQLGTFHRNGSLEPGKDGDFVLWSGDPLSTSSIALETWIDGKKYFDRTADLARRAALEKERVELVERAKRLLEAEKRKAREKAAEEALEPKEQEAPEAPGTAPVAPSPGTPEPVERPAVPVRPPEEPEKRPPSSPPAPTPTPQAVR